jgi:hypothetical protein
MREFDGYYERHEGYKDVSENHTTEVYHYAERND